jgi:carbonic anhydrase
MDGRVQLPVIQWIKANYPVDFVDVITEAGMDKVLCNQDDISEVLRSIAISVNINKSTKLFVVGHFDCRGNPVEESVHRKEIQGAVKRLEKHWPNQQILGLWVNKNWTVELV